MAWRLYRLNKASVILARNYSRSLFNVSSYLHTSSRPLLPVPQTLFLKCRLIRTASKRWICLWMRRICQIVSGCPRRIRSLLFTVETSSALRSSTNCLQQAWSRTLLSRAGKPELASEKLAIDSFVSFFESLGLSLSRLTTFSSTSRRWWSRSFTTKILVVRALMMR